MPVVLRIDGFKLLFYANEGHPREPVHIHIKLGRDEAKFWLFPDVLLAYNRGLSGPNLNAARRLAEAHRETCERAWNEFFD